MTPATEGRWVPLLALSTTVAVSFGVLLYSVSVLITEEAAGSAFSTTVLSAGYGGALLVGGLLAPSVGRRADRLGVRLIFVTGIVLGSLGVTVLSVANAPWHVLAAFWLLIGPAGSMTFYEPAFVAVEQWFGSARRARSLATLTVIGGLAGPIFLPVTSASGRRPRLASGGPGAGADPGRGWRPGRRAHGSYRLGARRCRLA